MQDPQQCNHNLLYSFAEFYIHSLSASDTERQEHHTSRQTNWPTKRHTKQLLCIKCSRHLFIMLSTWNISSLDISKEPMLSNSANHRYFSIYNQYTKIQLCERNLVKTKQKTCKKISYPIHECPTYILFLCKSLIHNFPYKYGN